MMLSMSKTKLIKTKAKSIFTKTKLPGAVWVVNQYVGCEHACLYCYAKFISKWRAGDLGKWGSWVEAKINAPELVKSKYVKGRVFMSSVSDPYQPIEEELNLTRRILENMDKNIQLSILTKSDLILRDVDILKQFKNIEIGFTINSFEGKAKEVFEPESISNEKRVKALEKLKKEGACPERSRRIKTYVFVSPIIPNLINLEDVILKTRNFSDYYWFEFINKRGAGREFADVLKKEFPKSFEILENKSKFEEFMLKCKKIINSAGIKVKGVEFH